jgi:hypothetical protein
MNNLTVILIFLVTTGLFFWGIFKALKSKKTIYMLAMVPFFLMMVGMFLL